MGTFSLGARYLLLPDLPALGFEARRLREALDLTQEELADRAGLHPN